MRESHLHRTTSNSMHSIWKIGFLERSLAALLLLILLPVLILCAIAILLNSDGPILFTQMRIGQGGKLFKIYKLRSMFDKAEITSGPQLSWPQDPRVTPVGRILRETHVDELPQLWNILKGEMSFFGPRPERPEVVTPNVHREFYTVRTVVKPGLTGLAQIYCPYESPLQQKFEYDKHYIKHQHSRQMRRFILVNTLRKTLRRQPNPKIPFL